MLSVGALRISFGDFEAVKGISFSLDKGETLAIVGESGSGKSLTALALMGLLPKAAKRKGIIKLSTEVRNLDLHSLSSDSDWQTVRGTEIAMIFQEPMSALNPVMTVGRQLQEAILQHQSISKREAKEKAIDWLKHVQLLEPERTYNKYPHQLSGGQKQRIVIAIALCNHPSLIIADEPTTALDATVQGEIIRLMQSLQKEQGATMIFITHDLSLAAAIADKAIVMYRGDVVEQGSAETIFKNPQHPYTQALLASRPTVESKGQRLQTVADFLSEAKDRNKTTTEGNLASSPVGGGTRWGPNAQPNTQPLLTVNNIQVSFVTQENWLGQATQYFDAVKEVSFNLYKGEVLGLVGESGSGKSTISRALMGLTPLRKGQIIYKGKDLSQNTAANWKETRRDIQLVFQDPFASLNPRMKVGDVLKEGIKRRKDYSSLSKSEMRIEVERLLDAVRLPADAAQKYPHQFSGGQRQRVGIARALSVQPDILLCDESVSALDVSVQAEILNLLTGLKKDFGLTYLFISHDLSVVHYISDRVMVMQQGRIIEYGPATQVLLHPQQDYTKRLVSASF